MAASTLSDGAFEWHLVEAGRQKLAHPWEPKDPNGQNDDRHQQHSVARRTAGEQRQRPDHQKPRLAQGWESLHEPSYRHLGKWCSGLKSARLRISRLDLSLRMRGQSGPAQF